MGTPGLSLRTRPVLVVGLGGNAISPPTGELSYRQERQAVAQAGDELAGLARVGGYRLVVVHGNGPQVGRLMRLEISGEDLDIHVAQTQGELGYLLTQALERAAGEPVSCLMTRVEVDPHDPAFANPEKPVGPVLDHRPEGAAVWLPEAGGWRRLVASPRPGSVPELATMSALLATGHLVAGGGGGIPVNRDVQGLPAVVDKDRLAALLAVALDAEALLIGTDVPGAYRNYGTPDQSLIRRMTVEQARAQLAAGAFAPGSMAPKVESAVDFAQRTGRPAVIAAVGELAAAMEGATGTRVAPATPQQSPMGARSGMIDG